MKEIDKLNRLLEETQNLLDGFSSGSLSPVSAYTSDDNRNNNNNSEEEDFFDENRNRKRENLNGKLERAAKKSKKEKERKDPTFDCFDSFELFNLLISQKADKAINHIESSSNFVKSLALHAAVEAGCLDLEVFKALLRAGCDPLEEDSKGRTALVRFLELEQQKNHVEDDSRHISTLLGEWELRRAATASSKIFKLIHSKNASGLLALLKNSQQQTQSISPAKILSKADPKYAGIAPLHEIAALNDTKMMEQILNAFPDVDLNVKAIGSGNTPLHEASHMSSSDMVKLLLESGAKEDIKNVAGQLAAHLGTEKIQVVMEIRNMMMKSQSRDVPSDKVKVKGDASKNIVTTSSNNNNNIFNHNNKFNESIQNSLQRDPHTGRTVLHRYARRNHRDKLMRFLNELGLNSDEKIRESKVFEVIDNSGHCPLYEAASEGSIEVAKVFLFGLREVDEKCSSGGGDGGCLVDPSIAAVMTGDTPLHAAAQSGNEDIAALLLVAGADKNARNIDGKRPIDLTKSKSIKKILEPERESKNLKSSIKKESIQHNNSSFGDNTNNSAIDSNTLDVPVKRGPGRPRKYPLPSDEDQSKQLKEKKKNSRQRKKVSIVVHAAFKEYPILPLKEIIDDDCVLLVKLFPDSDSWCLLYDQYRAIFNHLSSSNSNNPASEPAKEIIKVAEEGEAVVAALPRQGRRLVDVLQYKLSGGLIEKSCALRSIERVFNINFHGPFAYIDAQKLIQNQHKHSHHQHKHHHQQKVTLNPVGFPLKAKLKMDKISADANFLKFPSDFSHPLKSPKLHQI